MDLDTILFCTSMSVACVLVLGYDYYSTRKRELKEKRQKEEYEKERLSNYNKYFFQKLNSSLKGKHPSLKEFERDI